MPLSGSETIARVRQHQRETLLAFSCGKDAIAAWIAIRPHFDRVIPFYLYSVPGLEFVEESLDYYERFFGTRILRLPHPALHTWLNGFMFQPPEHCAVIEQAQLGEHSYNDIHDAIVEDHGLQEDILYATGVRAADSPLRRVAIHKHGPITWSQHKYHPVWDWNKQALVDCFRREGVKLPVDYAMFGRTFDGLDLRFLLPLKQHRPRDYQRVLEWFPLCELEVYRWERARAS